MGSVFAQMAYLLALPSFCVAIENAYANYIP